MFVCVIAKFEAAIADSVATIQQWQHVFVLQTQCFFSVRGGVGESVPYTIYGAVYMGTSSLTVSLCTTGWYCGTVMLSITGGCICS